jgi:hypothetical protein
VDGVYTPFFEIFHRAEPGGSVCLSRNQLIKAESWKFPFSGKCDVMRVKPHHSLKIAFMLLRRDHVASVIVNANHSVTVFFPYR